MFEDDAELVEQAERLGLDTEFFYESPSGLHSTYFMLQIMKDEKCRDILGRITEALQRDDAPGSILYDVQRLTTQLTKFYETPND